VIGSLLFASALRCRFDFLDGANNGYNQVAFGFAPIWGIVRTRPTTANEFYNNWRIAGKPKIPALLAFYQNTIDYGFSGLRWNYLPIILR
jgi:hypothetical protein